MLARTDLGRPTRVLLAGHIDTVPIADNVPSRRDGDTLHGCGTTDMKSGDAMLLHLAATLPEPSSDLTFVFYDCEEIEYERNGLTRIQAEVPGVAGAPTWPSSAEPTNGQVEAGCQGTAAVAADGARPALALGAIMVGGQRDPQVGRACWIGSPAFDARIVDIDGCEYHEGLNAVGITGGVASQRHPRRVHRSGSTSGSPRTAAPSRPSRCSQELFADVEMTVLDVAAGALPGLSAPGRCGVRRRGRWHREGEIRLDRRVPVRRAGYPGGELRPR